MTVRRARALAALPAAVLAGVLLAGCTDQPEEANDNGPQPDPVQPGDVERTPAPVESAPLTVPLPGETNSPDVSGDQTPSPASS
jgi:hypothetical protein